MDEPIFPLSILKKPCFKISQHVQGFVVGIHLEKTLVSVKSENILWQNVVLLIVNIQPGNLFLRVAIVRMSGCRSRRDFLGYSSLFPSWP